MAWGPITSSPGEKTDFILSVRLTAVGSARRPASCCTRPSQNSLVLSCSEKSAGLLRGMIVPPPRLGPKPMPFTPSDSVRASPVANSGRWQVAHETPSLPERTLSKKSAWPSATSSSETAGGAGNGWMPAAKSSWRRASTLRSLVWPPPEEPPLLQANASRADEQTRTITDKRDMSILLWEGAARQRPGHGETGSCDRHLEDPRSFSSPREREVERNLERAPNRPKSYAHAS